MAIYDSIVALMTSALSPEAVSIEQISKLALLFLIAPVLYFSINSEHFVTTADCGLWTPGGGDVHPEFCSPKEVPAVIPPDVIVLGDGD